MTHTEGMFHISKLLLTAFLWGEASFCHILQPARGGRSLLLLLPAADDYEKQCILYCQLSDWPVAEISLQQLNHFPPIYFYLLMHACLAPGI